MSHLYIEEQGMTYVREEDTWNTTTSVNPFLVSILFIIATLQVSLMARYRVLMCLNATLVRSIDGRAEEFIMLGEARSSVLPAKGQISCRDNLDKVHEVESLFVSMLLGVVKGVDVVIRPATRAGTSVLILYTLNNYIAQLRTESELVDLVRESMRIFVFEVVFQIMHVHVAVGERLSGSDMEVSNDLVDTDATFETASFLALLVKMLCVVLPLALFDTLSTTEGP